MKNADSKTLVVACQNFAFETVWQVLIRFIRCKMLHFLNIVLLNGVTSKKDD